MLPRWPRCTCLPVWSTAAVCDGLCCAAQSCIRAVSCVVFSQLWAWSRVNRELYKARCVFLSSKKKKNTDKQSVSVFTLRHISGLCRVGEVGALSNPSMLWAWTPHLQSSLSTSLSAPLLLAIPRSPALFLPSIFLPFSLRLYLVHTGEKICSLHYWQQLKITSSSSVYLLSISSNMDITRCLLPHTHSQPGVNSASAPPHLKGHWFQHQCSMNNVLTRERSAACL